MMYSSALAALAALAVTAPSPTVENRENLQARAACASTITVAPRSNIFASRTLHANSAYASEISAAMGQCDRYINHCTGFTGGANGHFLVDVSDMQNFA
jgi:hypothetical protein